MDESMCSVNDQASMSNEVQSYNEHCQVIHYNKIFCKGMIPNIKFKNGYCYWFFFRPFDTWI